MTSRRDFLKTMAAASAVPGGILAESKTPTIANTLYRDLRGFNYQPSYGSDGLELWQKFDLPTIDIELTQGKQFFPKMSAIRVWLSWDAYLRNPNLFEQRFEAALGSAAKHGLTVMPVLFNRWHNFVLDYGGIYLDHLLLPIEDRRKLFRPYLDSIVGKHANDARIFAWDLCNEPKLTHLSPNWTAEFRDAEYSWLKDISTSCKELGAKQPLCIGTLASAEDLKFIEPICDILTTHPYFINQKRQDLDNLDKMVEFANQVKKPLLATETCWGSTDDNKRVAILEWTLTELKKRDIGWLAYVLHHSLIADAHRPEFGTMDHAGNLAFIEADGSLRPGHGIFNNF